MSIFILVRVTWAPFKSGELWSSVKSDCFAIRFSVAWSSARNRFYRGKSAQSVSYLKIASSWRRYRHLVVIGMFGHVLTWISSSPKMFVTLSVTLCVTWISSSHKSLFFYYVLIFFQIFAHLMSVNSVSFYLLLIDWKYIGFTLQYICIRNFFRFWIRLIFIQLSVTLSRIQEKFVVVIFCLLIWKKLAAKFCGKKGIWEV
jgi:hypothetical protein